MKKHKHLMKLLLPYLLQCPIRTQTTIRLRFRFGAKG